MKDLIKKWLDLCQVSLVDLDIPEVPMELKKRVEIYEKLVDVETGLYRESPSYVYGLLQDELNFGHIVQAEV